MARMKLIINTNNNVFKDDNIELIRILNDISKTIQNNIMLPYVISDIDGNEVGVISWKKEDISDREFNYFDK